MEDYNKEDDNNKDDNDENGISAQGQYRDLRLREDIKGIGLDDDDVIDNDDKEEEEDKVEDNNKDNNDDKGISALGLDRDQGFSRGHQGHRPR